MSASNKLRNHVQLSFVSASTTAYANEKYVVDISAGKASRARERAQDAVDGTHTAQSTNYESTVMS